MFHKKKPKHKMSNHSRKCNCIIENVETSSKTSKHHRKCRSHGQGKRNNVVTVPDYQHRAWHALFMNLTADKVAEIINRKWIDPDYTFVCVKTEDYYATVRELNPTQSETCHLQLVSSSSR